MSTVLGLIRDTFRQSLACGLFSILFALTFMLTAVCLSIRVGPPSTLAASGNPNAKDPTSFKQSAMPGTNGDFTIAFGAIRIPLGREPRQAVHFLQLLLAGGVADTLGLLLTLIWTAGFLPGFLEGRSVTVLLAKPTPRWVLLAGKYLGVLAFVLFHATLFVVGTWLAIGWRTGIWDGTYLFAIPLLVLHFAVFFSVSLLLAVCTRSTVVCAFGSILFWSIAWAMNYGRHALAARSQLMPDGHFSSSVSWLVDFGYWVLPKPADFGMLLYNALDAKDFFGSTFDAASLAAHGFSLWLSVLTSLAFTAYMLFAAARRFATLDY
jgi:ABC-type transport system involved in multi-copper enzyme maturation permease subunit